QASIGQGVSMLPVGLESGNPVVIGEVLIASTSHLKKQAITINNIDEALDEIAENIGLEEFGSDILTELGKRPMTRNLVEVVETEEKPAEA
ncbi:TPA: phage tail protein, partial [Staphylococcus aureus]|nr:phage tail protein [Staphylococcus aureus]HDJ6351293.1 phage tail protein [Staphylococcus aureus]